MEASLLGVLLGLPEQSTRQRLHLRVQDVPQLGEALEIRRRFAQFLEELSFVGVFSEAKHDECLCRSRIKRSPEVSKQRSWASILCAETAHDQGRSGDFCQILPHQD